jgi:hypothetical protein
MESAPKLFGKELTPEDREDADKTITKRSLQGLERVGGEIEKSEEMTRFIEVVGGYLNKELESLGLEPFSFDLQRIHLLPAENFGKKFKESESNGVYTELSDGIYLKDNASRMRLYKSAFHEMVHQASRRSYYVHVDPGGNKMRRTRTGYVSHHPIEGHEHFRGLNEAVVDNIVRDIFRKNQDELVAAFNISEQEQHEEVDWYTRYMDILDVIVSGIANKNDENPEAVMARFMRGEFTGEMMHLRDVERTFGKGSLRMLAAMESSTKGDEITADENILEYFETDDEASRDKLAKEVLIERERMRYIQRKASSKKKRSWMSFFGLFFSE